MAAPIIVYPPDEEGGRKVRFDGEILGRAFNIYDVLELLGGAGLDPAATALDDTNIFDWRGGGPYKWEPDDTTDHQPGA